MKALLSLALAVGIGMMLTSGIHAQDASGPKGKIAFTRLDGDDGKLFVISADGKDLKPIVTTSKNNLYPVWSPDGKQIAYTGFESLQTPPDVFVINADGSNEKRLSDGTGFSVMPCWSPDAKQILFTTRAGTSNGGTLLRLVNLDGSTAQDYKVEGRGFFSFWSPDGKRLGYTKIDVGGATPSGTVHLMNADGTGVEQFANSAGLNIAGPGAWSPDGKSLLTTRLDPSAMTAGLWLTDVNTKSENQLASFGIVMREPIMPTAVWSPDGKWIACAMFEIGKGRIHLVSRDGQTKKALTPDADFCFAPTWTK